MAYTYDDFVAAANNAGMLSKFSQQDLVTAQKSPEFGLSMLSLLKDLDSSTTEEQRLLATEAANQLRKTYGSYTQDAAGATSYAGSYGSQINDTLEKINNYGGYSYDSEDAYQQLMDKIANAEPFSYDHTTDPQYSAYKKAYLREGDRATQNAVAQASALTGGVASSYAATAGAQAGNYYAGQLADIIPTLYQNSYEQYLNYANLDLSKLTAMQTDREFDYQDYLNQYSMLNSALSGLQTQESTEYNRYLDALNLAKQNEQDAYQKALSAYEMLGYATPEIAQILGINADLTSKQVSALQQAMNSLGQNLVVDGIVGNNTNSALQKLGYMDAWPAYQAMVAAGIIDADGNFTGTGGEYKGSTGVYSGLKDSGETTIEDEFAALAKYATRDEISTFLSEGVKSGEISPAERQRLEEKYSIYYYGRY